MPDDAKPNDQPSTPSEASSANGSALLYAPEFAMASLYQSYAHSTGLLYENAVQAQQQLATIAQVATLVGVLALYGVAPQPAAAKNGSAAPAAR